MNLRALFPIKCARFWLSGFDLVWAKWQLTNLSGINMDFLGVKRVYK